MKIDAPLAAAMKKLAKRSQSAAASRKSKTSSPLISSSEQSEDERAANMHSDDRRKIKHYSMVQNKPIYFEGLKEFDNKVMLSIDVPRYFYLDKPGTCKLSQAEIDYETRMRETVIYITMKESMDARQLSEIFNVYGDVNVNFFI